MLLLELLLKALDVLLEIMVWYVINDASLLEREQEPWGGGVAVSGTALWGADDIGTS